MDFFIKNILLSLILFLCGIDLSLAKENADVRKINVNGVQYVLPNFVEIHLGKKTIYKDDKIRPWDKSDRTSQFKNGQYIFFTSRYNDGIDIDVTRLFIIKGDQVKEQSSIMTGNWIDKFIMTKAEKLFYWSEWFCDPSNEKVKLKGAYIFEFSPKKGEFQERPMVVPQQMHCKVDYIENKLNGSK